MMKDGAAPTNDPKSWRVCVMNVVYDKRVWYLGFQGVPNSPAPGLAAVLRHMAEASSSTKRDLTTGGVTIAIGIVEACLCGCVLEEYGSVLRREKKGSHDGKIYRRILPPARPPALHLFLVVWLSLLDLVIYIKVELTTLG